MRILLALNAALAVVLACGSVSVAHLDSPAPNSERPVLDSESAAPIVRVTFSVMGDIPYTVEEADLLKEQVAGLPDESEFLVHVGDIKPGFFPCLNLMYQGVADSLKESDVPVFIIPGDNEWNDCPRPEAGKAHWRRNFASFEKHWDHDFEVSRQDDYPENFAFVHQRVLFIGINLLGGRVLDQDEWDARLEADADWVQSQVETRHAEADHLVLYAHAGPSEKQKIFFDRFEKTARWFTKPVLLIHGDGHRWRSDQPFDLGNIYRVQVDQGGIAPPLTVKVVVGDLKPFHFERGARYRNGRRTTDDE